MKKPLLILTNNTNLVEEYQIYFDISGYIGGGLLSICLIPQIVKVCSSKSAQDISYMWQILAILGLLFIAIYGIFSALLPVFIPVSLELFLMIILTCQKIFYDTRLVNKKRKEKDLAKI